MVFDIIKMRQRSKSFSEARKGAVKRVYEKFVESGKKD